MRLDATPPVASPNPGVFLFTNAQGTEYVRNNPLRFVDPSGERVELLGNDEEARKKALAVIASGLSKRAESRLRIDSVMENGKTHYYVGVDDGLKTFSKMGEAASDLANLIGAKPTVEFGLTNGVLPGKGAGEAAYSYAPGEIGNQNVRILLNPAEVNNARVTMSTNIIQRAKFSTGLLRDLTRALHPGTSLAMRGPCGSTCRREGV
jgi:hypothetical protein